METEGEAGDASEVERDIERLQRALAGTPGPSVDSRRDARAPARGSRAELLDAALALNEEMSRRVEGLQGVLERRLGDVRARLEATRCTIARFLRQRRAAATAFKYHLCGTPYFRDKEGNWPPLNGDALHMQAMGTANYFLFQSLRGWTARDKCNLRSELLTAARHSKRDNLTRELATIRLSDPEQRKLRIQEIRQELYRVDDMSLSQLALPSHEDFNWDDVAASLKTRHSPSECCGMWKLLLKPSINQNIFTKLEQYELGLIVHKFNCQDWDSIALELGTGRSGFQCFVHFRSIMVTIHNGARWSKEEDNYLMSVIDSCRCGNVIPWSRVASYFENKTKLQIYNRWTNSVRPALMKGRFLPEEDAVLFACIDKFGPDFSKVALFLPQRSLTQLRNHYEFVLSRDQSVYWTAEEDRKLLSLMAHVDGGEGPVVARAFAVAAQHFPDKGRIVLRPRFLMLRDWVKMNPQLSLEEAPRRARRELRRVERMDLATAVNRLAQRLDIERARRARPKVNVDKLLTELFNKKLCRNHNNETASSRRANGKEVPLGNNILNLRRILLLLKADLDRAKFSESEFTSKYEQLLFGDPDFSFEPKFKTYSRKRNTNCINNLYVTPSTTIWDDSRTYEAKYLMPPCYSTVAGCQNILYTLHEQKQTQILILHNTTHMAYTKFLERCEILFTWPMILSNLIPKLLHNLYDAQGIASKLQESIQAPPLIDKRARTFQILPNNAVRKKGSRKVKVSEIKLDSPPSSSEAQSETLEGGAVSEETVQSIEYEIPVCTPKKIIKKRKRDVRGFLKPGGYQVVVDERLEKIIKESFEKKPNKKRKK